MKIYSIVLLIFILTSCSSYKRTKFTYKENNKESWISTYKYEVFYGCMQQGMGNDSLYIVLKNKDLFNKNQDLTLFSAQQARELGKNIIKNMPAAYIKIDTGEEHLKDKNFISYSCLLYYASRELDSIARSEYDKSIKREK